MNKSMNRKVWLLIVGLFIGIGVMNAQVKTVSGVVVSAEDGLPIIGASVELEGTAISAMTDLEGKFLIKDVPSSVEKMSVRFVGMKTVKMAVASDMIVKMRLDSKFPYGKNVIYVGYNQWSSDDTKMFKGFSVGYSRRFELSSSKNFFLEMGVLLADSKRKGGSRHCRVNLPVSFGYMFNVGQSGFSISPKVGWSWAANLRDAKDRSYEQEYYACGYAVQAGLDMAYKHWVLSASCMVHTGECHLDDDIYDSPLELNVGIGYCF